MGNLSYADLKQILAEAKTKIEIGAKYSHYKDSSKEYEVIDLVINEADDEPLVIYEALYPGLENVRFARKLDIFLEQVEVDGKMVNRFSLV